MTEEGSPRGRSMVMSEILRYLIDHPDAKDTMEGVCRWWFPQGDGDLDMETLQEALDSLVSRSWVLKREITPSKIIYGMNKERLEEMRAFMDESMNKKEEE